MIYALVFALLPFVLVGVSIVHGALDGETSVSRLRPRLIAVFVVGSCLSVFSLMIILFG